ncbi:putative LysR family transcriptional regulator [Vibrio halioticoli NBRC 102217]|uniref:Putative LysR family transcriptional regulator n=1 Tax=Vibrio halioticoli NBRC 102217 TaxID=1219072 RepID=V5HKV3_9VIBR|nr:LysR family transcriptional regulator [Vibrio halioticoli]GAD89845.1 putative LysR family transcriptional regulator [Vibrio halioticoli NBRC 102217]
MHNYKLLIALDSLLKTRNLTLSAQELNVSQSAMSKTLLQIRDAFGDPILIREGNQFSLSQRAIHLQKELPELLQRLNRLYSPDEVVPKEISRRFTLAFNAFIAPKMLPVICQQLEQESPLSSLTTQLWQNEDLSELHKGSIDLVATMAEEIPENLYGKRLGGDKYVVLMSASHPLATMSMTTKRYMDAKHILVNGVVDKQREVDRLIADAEQQRSIFATAPSFESAVEALLLTHTLMTVPLHIAARFSNKELVVKPIPFDTDEHHYYLLWHARYNNDPEHQWFRELCLPLIKDELCKSIELGKQAFS